MREKEKERLRLVRAFNEEWICPHYVILGHFSKKRDQKESHPPRFLFFVSFCSQKDSREFLSFFLDFACLEALSFPDLFIFYRRHIYLSLFFFFFRERERERKKDRRERETKYENSRASRETTTFATL
jgi:hypothetical protein